VSDGNYLQSPSASIPFSAGKPRGPRVRGLSTVLEHRMQSSEVDGPLEEVLDPAGLELLAQRYLASVQGQQAGDLRHTLAVMRRR
jgi:hypothetical protein